MNGFINEGFRQSCSNYINKTIYVLV